MIPRPNNAFAVWLLNFATVFAAAPVTYGYTAGDATAVTNAQLAFQAAHELAEAPATRTTATIADRDAKRANAEYVVRAYAAPISRSRSVTNEQKAAIGVTIPNVIPTPIPAPTDAPELSIQSAIPNLVTIAAKVPGSAGKAKPAGCVGMELRASVGTVAATDPAQASFVAITTKSPLQYAPGVGNSGKIVTLFARYTTRSGPGGVAQAGPWSTPLVFAAL